MRILLGADGSDFARIAEELIVRLPFLRSGEVICASVAPGLPLMFASGPTLVPEAMPVEAEVLVEAEQVAEAKAKEFATAAVSRLKDRGVAATSVLLEGDPGRELLAFAELEKLDLIAIGSRGLGPIESVILGSAARKLVGHAPCHVLVGRAIKGKSVQETLKTVTTDSKLSLAVGVDGTAGAKVAVDFINAQGKEAFEKVNAVCVEPLSVIPAGIDPAVFSDVYRYDHERAVAIAKKSAEELSLSAEKVTWSAELGRPANRISKIAEQNGCDLIVVGATRHGTLERFLIGSVSYELATEGSRSVLVVRPKS